MLRRVALSIAAGVIALILTYPVVCAGGEFQPIDRCENLFGLWLPGFSYRAPDEEWKVYVAPLAATILAAVAVWILLGRATSRS